MWRANEGTRIFLALGATDMRKQMNGLSMLVCNQLGGDLLSGDWFVFCNRMRNLIKALYWDRTGFCMWQKRLEKERFKWPNNEVEMMEINKQEWCWLLEGLDINQAHKRLSYTTVL